MPKLLKILSFLLLCALCLGGGFILGRRTAPDAPIVQEVIGTTFYAAITRISDDSMLVDGLDINSLNFQGAFSFVIHEDTRLTWNYTEIAMADFQVGDRVAITFTGGIRETYPARLVKVLRVDLLDHERNTTPEHESSALLVSRVESDDPIPLFPEDAAWLLELLKNAEWMNDSTKCEPDCRLTYDGQTIYYHSDCGSFNVQKHCLILSEPQKAEVNALLSAYISLGFEAP